MEKRLLLRYLADKKEQIRRLKVLSRSLKIQKTKQFVIPIIGPRRAGKSFYLYDLILNKFKIKDEDFIYLNFEDPEMIGAGIKDMLDAVSVHEEFYGKIPVSSRKCRQTFKSGYNYIMIHGYRPK